MEAGIGTKVLLPMFKQSYAKRKRYTFFPVEVDASGRPSPHFDLAIGKRSIVLRSFHEIDVEGGMDPDSILVRDRLANGRVADASR